MAFADEALRAHQTLGDGRLVGQENTRNFTYAEPAYQLEAERDAGVLMQIGVAAHEDHAEFVVSETRLGVEAVGVYFAKVECLIFEARDELRVVMLLKF